MAKQADKVFGCILILDPNCTGDVEAAGGTRAVGRPRKEVDPGAIQDLYTEQGLPLATVAGLLGVSALTLRARMNDFGIPARKRGRPRKLEDFELALDPNYTESKRAQRDLRDLLAAEAEELAEA